MTGDPIVDVRHVSRHYGPVRAVDGIDLSVRRGEVFGLIGHNGAGKSSLLRLILGLEHATTGEIFVDGVPVSGGGFRAVRRRMGYLPENVVLYDNLTALETLGFFARLKGVPVSACPAALDRVGLGYAGSRRVGEFSRGMRQRLGVAQALLGTPRLLLLDEPTTGLDPEGIRAFYVLLRDLEADGVTVVLSSHGLAEIQDRVGRLAIVVAGRVRATGTVAQLREQVNLPVSLRMVTRGGARASVLDALARLPVSDVDASGDVIRLRCDRGAKMSVLAALATRPADVLDIHVHEPSLEDVFFGVAD
jgi:Cu-processing system ATP-binding protein